MLNGQVPEWSIGAVLKTVVAQATEGSNPSLSATGLLSLLIAFDYFQLRCAGPYTGPYSDLRMALVCEGRPPLPAPPAHPGCPGAKPTTGLLWVAGSGYLPTGLGGAFHEKRRGDGHCTQAGMERVPT